MAIVKEKILSVKKWGGGVPLGAMGANVSQFYVASVVYNEKPYKVRSLFYPKGEYIGFDVDSTPDKYGHYLEMGVYDSAD